MARPAKITQRQSELLNICWTGESPEHLSRRGYEKEDIELLLEKGCLRWRDNALVTTPKGERAFYAPKNVNQREASPTEG